MPRFLSMAVIAADIGGTNARFIAREGEHTLLSKSYPSKEFQSIVPVIQEFLHTLAARSGTVQLAACAIAAAGPVEITGSGDRLLKGVNLGWTISESEIQSLLGCPCHLMNDMEAAAWALTGPVPEAWIKVAGPDPDPNGHKALIGSGTGLGEAFLVRCGHNGSGDWYAVASEGGHASFAPNGEIQERLLVHMRVAYGHVSVERLASGSGLAAIYSFLAHEQGKARNGPGPAPETVARQARDGNPLANAAFDLFVEILGSEAGNLALKVLPKGGVFLAGGVVVKNLSLFDERRRDLLVRSFRAKGRVSPLLETIPIFLVDTEELGLEGAVKRASLTARTVGSSREVWP